MNKMKNLFLLTTSIFLSFQFLANEITVESKVQDVIIYHSGALVNRVATTELKPGLNELVFMNVSSKIILNSLQISNKEVTILNKTLVRKLTAEVYIFCVLTEKEVAKADVLNLDQWQFYVVRTSTLDEQLPTKKKIGIRPLQQIASPVHYTKLKDILDILIDAELTEGLVL